MRDVTEQLTAYFDATVERVTADDVLAGSHVRSQDGQRAPARVPRLRPAWVVAVGFVATIVVVGGAIGFARLLEGDPAGVSSDSPPFSDTGEGLAGPWGLLIGVGVLLALAVVGLVWRNQIAKERIMQTLERPEVEVSPRPRSPAILVLLAALLVLAAGALGWWIGSSGESANVPEIVEAWNRAWVDNDEEAVAALYAEDGIFADVETDQPVTQDDQWVGRSKIAAHVGLGMQFADIEEMTVDNAVVVGDLVAYKWTARGMSAMAGPSERDPFETSGLTVFEMKDGLIIRSTLYYDNAELYNMNPP